MAIYVYRSRDCVCPDIEVQHSMSEDPDVRCEVHGVSMSRVPQAAGVILKGGGYYSTDKDTRAKGDADKGIAPARPAELGGKLDTRKKK